MSETNDSSARGAGKTLSLKKTETSTVKQSFSHGRTKAVVVEKKRVRVDGPTGCAVCTRKAKPSETKTAAPVAAPTVAPPATRTHAPASFCGN
jgi:translation initiation factor IF-2